MRQNSFKKVESQGLIRATLIVFFVAFMVSDACCMSSCAGERDELRFPGTITVTASAAGQPVPSVSTEDTGDCHDSNSESDDDGCFCSGHLLHTLPVGIVRLEAGPAVADSLETSLPTPPRQTLFHPPRSS